MPDIYWQAGCSLRIDFLVSIAMKGKQEKFQRFDVQLTVVARGTAWDMFAGFLC